jgi:outer membrane protein OmpA-like peptidoglycan-associated protein
MRIFLPLLVLAAAGAAAQAPVSGVTYVFFDWGKTELTRDAMAELDKVAADYAASPRPLTLDGHSDRSGPAAINLRGSRTRAELVRDYLAGKGVPATAMTVRAYGESTPIIVTEDGVREVQNRRVEVRSSRH